MRDEPSGKVLLKCKAKEIVRAKIDLVPDFVVQGKQHLHRMTASQLGHAIADFLLWLRKCVNFLVGHTRQLRLFPLDVDEWISMFPSATGHLLKTRYVEQADCTLSEDLLALTPGHPMHNFSPFVDLSYQHTAMDGATRSLVREVLTQQLNEQSPTNDLGSLETVYAALKPFLLATPRPESRNHLDSASTEYNGRVALGLVPRRVMGNDVVCHFLGSLYPSAITATSNNGHQLLGDAFVLGLTPEDRRFDLPEPEWIRFD